MQKLVDAEKQLKSWNPLSQELILVGTKIGVKSLSLSNLELEPSLRDAPRLHLVHSLKKRW